MMIVHHGHNSDEESMDEDDENSFTSKIQQITRYDKILTIVTSPKKEDEEDQEERKIKMKKAKAKLMMKKTIQTMTIQINNIRWTQMILDIAVFI